MKEVFFEVPYFHILKFQKTKLTVKVDHKENKELDVEVTIFPKNQSPVLLHGTITLKK